MICFSKYCLVFFSFSFLIFFASAEEAVFFNGQKIEYESIFSLSDEGITFETKNGLAFHSWNSFGENEAERLSGGKYHEYQELQKKKKERPKSPEISSKAQPVSGSKLKGAKGNFSSEKSPGPAQNAVPVSSQKEFSSARLDRLIDFSNPIWTWSLPDFMKHQQGMGYLIRDQLNDGVEMTRSYSGQLKFLDLQVWESVAVFRNGRLQELNLLLYNRGDADDMTKKEFSGFLQSVDNKMSAWLKVKPVSLRDPDINRNFKEENRIWTKRAYQFQLRWSMSQDSHYAEYVRLKIKPFDLDNPNQSRLFAQESSSQNELTFYDLASRVKKTGNGDILIEGIPMVDQGKKGYCVVATAERVLTYYGRQVNQHQLAKLAGTSTVGGTSEKEMMVTLYKIGQTEDVKIEKYYLMSPKEFMKMLERYNKKAYRTKSAAIINHTVDSVEELYRRLDRDLIKQIRLKDHGDYEKFKETVIRQTSMGIPVLWCVIYGIVPETPGIQGYGNHMRLIIGFNPEASEILYTDSWGMGHELKRMSFENAWTMTTGVYSLQPKHWSYSSMGHLDFQLGLDQKSLPAGRKQK